MSATSPAFPPSHDPATHEFGLTKREYFAAAALQGITANPNFFGSLFQQNALAASDFAVECADAIIVRLTMGRAA